MMAQKKDDGLSLMDIEYWYDVDESDGNNRRMNDYFCKKSTKLGQLAFSLGLILLFWIF